MGNAIRIQANTVIAHGIYQLVAQITIRTFGVNKVIRYVRGISLHISGCFCVCLIGCPLTYLSKASLSLTLCPCCRIALLFDMFKALIYIFRSINLFT